MSNNNNKGKVFEKALAKVVPSWNRAVLLQRAAVVVVFLPQDPRGVSRVSTVVLGQSSFAPD